MAECERVFTDTTMDHGFSRLERIFAETGEHRRRGLIGFSRIYYLVVVVFLNGIRKPVNNGVSGLILSAGGESLVNLRAD